jgi:hypothetical protein
MAVAADMDIAQHGQHYIFGLFADLEPAKVSDNLRLPSTIHAPPAIALEAENPESAITGIVSALTA